jgi:hypothetical protein
VAADALAENQRAFVVDESNRVLGALNMHDLFRAGVI